MFCTQCGAKLADSARFCTSCGKATGAGPDGHTTASSPRRLRRIREQKKIAGVCAGFAEYFETDITVMRVIWIALLLIPPHIGLIAYLVSWAVLPKT
jgi:phage shock protein C